MTDEELLAMLRGLESDPIDPRLDRLAEDPDGAALLAALEADARDDPALARDLALFTPLDGDIDARIAEQVLATTATSPLAEGSPAALEAPRNRWIWAAAAVVAAIVLAFVALRSAPPEAHGPRWTVEALSGQKQVRDDAAPAPVHGPGSVVKIALRPDTPVTTPVQVTAWWTAGDTATRLDDRFLRTAANGATLFKAPIDAFEPAHIGTQRLLLVVGVPGSVPSARRIPVAELTEGTAWQVLGYAFERRASP